MVDWTAIERSADGRMINAPYYGGDCEELWEDYLNGNFSKEDVDQIIEEEAGDFGELDVHSFLDLKELIEQKDKNNF
jgi:hypothetical protein